MSRVLLVGAIALWVVGCGGKAAGPTAALHAYSELLEASDYDDAYAMMSEEFRAKHSREEFLALLKENRSEVSQTAKRLKGEAAGVEVSAEFNYGLGDTMRLVFEDGRWKIASNPAQFYSQSSPAEALRSFVRAYQAKRWDVMLRYVPKEYRDRMTKETIREQFDGESKDEVAEMMKRIAAHMNAPITINGREARMPYMDKYEVIFRRENGGWTIHDLDG